MKYLISGYFGFGNAGDDAILTAMVEQLRAVDPEAEISVVGPSRRRLGLDDDGGNDAGAAVGAADRFARLGVHVVPRDRWGSFMKALRGADLFISGGGGLLQDDTSRASLGFYVSHLMAAQALRRRRMVFAQGIGPLNHFESRVLVRLALRGATVSVRDEESAELLARCGINRRRIHVTADPVFGWFPRLAAREGGPWRRAPGDIRDATGLAIIWRPFLASEVGLRLLWPDLQRWARDRGLRPVFFALQPGSDVTELRLAGVPRESIVTFEEPERWPEALAHCRLTLSVRYHGILFSALAGVPALGIAYDPKVTALCRQLGLPEPIPADDIGSADLLARLDALDRVAERWHAELPARLEHLAARAAFTARLAWAAARGETMVPEGADTSNDAAPALRSVPPALQAGVAPSAQLEAPAAAVLEAAPVAETAAEAVSAARAAGGVERPAGVEPGTAPRAGSAVEEAPAGEPVSGEPVSGAETVSPRETVRPRQGVSPVEVEPAADEGASAEAVPGAAVDGAAPARAEVLGVPLDPVSLDEAADMIVAWTGLSGGRRTGTGERGPTRVVVTANPELIMRAQGDDTVKEALAAASLIVADGVGVVWAGRRSGVPLPGRVPGIDLAEVVMARGAPLGLKVFLCGSRRGVAPRAALRLRRRFPGLQVVGATHGYFTPDEEDELVERIAASGADLLLLGLGAPRQELWLSQRRHRLKVPVAIGVGGALDVWSGRVSRAPRWMQKTGTEWLWRFIRQPWRALRLLVLPRFVWRVWRTPRAR